MPSDRTVLVDGLSKKYDLFDSPRDRLKEVLHPLRRRFHREFWALQDVSFEVSPGTALGILGRNGSGKSTLLQVIAGILQPTRGSVVVSGRVSALLELGAGFHPDLTGRQNVLLQGSIQGMDATEMHERMGRVEAFADIGEFFDQPLRTYSSGMFLRTAFAAAINVDPDVLIVDEALSVGDARFQHKCFERISRFRREGKTILLVTHDVHAVTAHCDHVIVLEGGRLHAEGEPKRMADTFLSLLFETRPSHGRQLVEKRPVPAARAPRNALESFLADESSEHRITARGTYNPYETRTGSREAEIIDFFVCSGESDDENGRLRFGDACRVFLKLLFHVRMDFPIAGLAVRSTSGAYVTASNSRLLQTRLGPYDAGAVVVVEASFESGLRPGEYFLDLGVAQEDGTIGGRALDIRRSVVHLTVVSEREPNFEGVVDLGLSFRAQARVPDASFEEGAHEIHQEE